MSILSILGGGGTKNDLSEARQRSLILILEALALNAPAIGSDATTEYQTSLRAFGAKLETAVNPEDYLLITGQVVQTLLLFCQNTERYSHALRAETQSMVDFLTTSLVQVSKSSGQSVTSLRDIEKRLVAATAIEDIRELRTQLKKAVELIQYEATRQEVEVESLRATAATARASQSGTPLPSLNLDEVTGLPSARDCEAVVNAITFGDDDYPAVFFLERLDMINGRYGYKVGDKILVLYSQFLAQHLKPTDRLFRWRGPSFVAVLKRNASIDSIRAELKRFSGAKLEHLIEVDQRKVMMTISSVCALITISKETGPGEAVRRIETFVTAQAALNPTSPDRNLPKSL